MAECLFCRIASGELEAAIVYQDDSVVAFRDTNPRAPVHILIIPRKHISSVNETSEEDEATLGHVVRIAAGLASEEGVAESGYRLVTNCGAAAGQSVDHVHFHLLGGRSLGWPPG